MSEFVEDIDLEEYETEEALEKPDGVPPGWYRATITDVDKDPKSGAIILKFEVCDGEHAGQKIEERLWDPSKSGGDAKKEDFSRKRRAIFARRIGLLGADDFGKKVSVDWLKAVGHTVAINVKERKYKDNAGNEKIARNIDFAGIFQPDDQRVPEEIRGAAPPPGSGSQRPPKNKPQEGDFDGI